MAKQKYALLFLLFLVALVAAGCSAGRSNPEKSLVVEGLIQEGKTYTVDPARWTSVEILPPQGGSLASYLRLRQGEEEVLCRLRGTGENYTVMVRHGSHTWWFIDN